MSDPILATSDFELEVGESRTFQVTVTRTDYTVTPPTVTPVDLRLNGTEIVFAVKRRRSDASPLFTKSIGSGVLVIGTSPGDVMQILLDGTEFTASSADNVYDWTVRVKEPGGATSDVSRGRLFVRPAIAITP